MTEEEKKPILGDLYEKLNKAQTAGQHQAVLDHTEKSKPHPPSTYIYTPLFLSSPVGHSREPALGTSGPPHGPRED